MLSVIPDLEVTNNTLGDDSATVSRSAWTRSSYCSDGSCVEVSINAQRVGVRDNKDLSCGPLWLSIGEWRAFVGAIREGDFS